MRIRLHQLEEIKSKSIFTRSFVVAALNSSPFPKKASSALLLAVGTRVSLKIFEI
jgi:hypothetical protein